MASSGSITPEKDKEHQSLAKKLSGTISKTLGLKKSPSLRDNAEPEQLVEEPVPLEDNEGKSQHDRFFEKKRHSQEDVC